MVHVVDELFPGIQCRTVVWISERARKEFDHFRTKIENPPKLFRKIRYYAEAGFELFEGKKKPIRPEWDGVYRIGDPSTLFRLVGFYDGGSRGTFVIIRTYMKSGQDADPAVINDVANVRKYRRWKRRGD